MAKIDQILQLLETRIARGDYAMTLFPTEHGLAEEMSVGRMTARRAILRLVEQGLLYRDSSGRLVVTIERSKNRPLHVGFVTATLTSGVMRWLDATLFSVHEAGGHMRVVTYFHWDDPALLEAIESFDGVFLVPPAEKLPAKLADRLNNCRARVAVLGTDYSDQGLRSVDVVSIGSVDALLDHLAALGHRQISVLNTQPFVQDIVDRIQGWQAWLAAHHCDGELINEPELSYGIPMERAYRVADIRLSAGQDLGGTAVMCTTMPAALGLMRAANEHGLTIGRDLSVCVINDEGLAPYLNPTLTSIRVGDPMRALHECLDWMAGGEWVGALLKHSSEVELYLGGSTGSAPEMSMADHSDGHRKTNPSKRDLVWLEKNKNGQVSLVDGS